MAKIHYEDLSLNKPKNYSRKNSSIAMMILVVLISLLLGAVGGIGGILALSADGGALAKKVGINLADISIPTTRTEKVVVEESSAIIDSANKVSPAVVSITLKTTVQDIFGQSYQQEGAGTGFIITNDGLILTNKHVVSDSSAKYTVVTTDGKSYDATVQSLDPVYDLAVIKIDAKNLPVVELGDSDQLKVGQWVVAIGNALGRFENTVTAGVISAKDRSIEASDASNGSSESISNLLQTDAAINSGNSGGPLVNLKGQVVGINTAVASGAQSIGFAIPINQAKSAIDSIKATGKIVRPYLGVRYLPITADIAKSASLPVDYGALIKGGNSITQLAVIPGSPADKAGLVENDIILEINGEKIDQNNSLLKLIQQYKVGDEIELKVLSKGKEKTVKLKLEESK
jgi:serine protease Do